MRIFGSGSSLILIAGVLLISMTSSAWAQWVLDGTAVSTATGDQQYPSIATDGAGGAIGTWHDNRAGNYDIYAQRIDASGTVRWATDGVALCTAAGHQLYPTIVSDGAGGVIVTWADNRAGDYDIYSQRVDASGSVQWTTDGVALCTAAGDQASPIIASDGAGGAIVTWYDGRGGSYSRYAQRIDASGSVQWAADGVAFCTTAVGQQDYTIASDGVGGAIVTWYDARAGNYDIYSQRIDASGTVQWAADGVALCTAMMSQRSPVIATDGAGGAIVTWYDYRGGMYDIYAQRIDASGAVQWTADGVALCTATARQESPAIVSDGAGGAIITWCDYRGASADIYAQRVDASGAVQWTADGVALCTAPGAQFLPTIATDGVGGAIVIWCDYRGASADIYAQRVDASGAVQWTADGVALCAAMGDYYDYTIVSDGAGGAIVTWYDYRSGNADIYAQRVTRQGYWGYPEPTITSIQDVPGDQGGQLRISFAASRLDAWPDLGITRYSIWRSLSPAAALAMKRQGARLASPNQARPDLVGRAYYSSTTGEWELIGTMEAHLLFQYGYTAATLRDSTSVDAGWESYFVSAHGSEPFDFWDSPPDSGYSVDNLSPCTPQALAGQYSGSCQILLHWTANTEADLSHYAIYRGTTADFLPSEVNRIGTTTDTSFVDDGYGPDCDYYYHYKVSAWDVHENEGTHSLLTPEEIMDVPGVERRYSNALFQNIPNPFTSSTLIAFSVERSAHVRLQVFDARGRLVQVLADDVREPQLYVEKWRGRDRSGRPVASGTYFYRLEVPGWTAVKKMTFVR